MVGSRGPCNDRKREEAVGHEKTEKEEKMSLGDFLSRYILLPLTAFFQLFGYAESAFRLTGLSHTFIIISTSFTLSTLLLIWFFYFSRPTQSPHQKLFALGCLVVFSIAYYTFIQYTLLDLKSQDVFKSAFYLESARAFAQVNPEKAITDIERIKHKYREIPEVYNIRGIAYYHLKRFDESFSSYRKAAELDHENQEYKYNLAVLLRELCNFNDAKRILEEYIGQRPLDTSGHYELAVIYHLMGDYDKAIPEYTIVTSRDNDRYKEASMFNMAVIFSLKLQRESDENVRNRYLNEIKLLLTESVKLGGTKRLEKIVEDITPLDQRPRVNHSCKQHYITDDLTSLASIEKFNEWLQGLRSRSF